MTLYRNQSIGERAELFYATAGDAKAAARNALLGGAAPFLRVAEPVEVPTGRRAVARFLNQLTATPQGAKATMASLAAAGSRS